MKLAEAYSIVTREEKVGEASNSVRYPGVGYACFINKNRACEEYLVYNFDLTIDFKKHYKRIIWDLTAKKDSL